MQPKFLVLEVQKITNFLELTFFLDLAGCALDSSGVNSRFETARSSSALISVLWLFQKPGIAPPVTTIVRVDIICN
jgi:hypothetical protein